MSGVLTEIRQYKERIKKDIILPLTEQMKELGISCGYDFFAVWECEVILTKYIRRLNKVKKTSNEETLKVVKWVVISLNRLNKRTNGFLIDTDIRESIYEILQSAAIEKGLKNCDEDITAEWREW